jgi:hypothetical protein
VLLEVWYTFQGLEVVIHGNLDDQKYPKNIKDNLKFWQECGEKRRVVYYSWK